MVRAPGRYLPLELHAARKPLEGARLKVALAFPDLYEVGLSHLGVRILYRLLNSLEGVACDRAYAPWEDMEKELRENDIPLCSHEHGAPLKDFDLLGFSLTYELSYTNVLAMLDLARVPLRAEDRAGVDWPLVIGGGPCASNPEPMAPFFDAFLFGDGEEAVVEICESVMKTRENGASKKETLEALAAIEGVYVPAFFEPRYNADGTIGRIEPLLPGRGRVRRRIVSDLDSAYFPEQTMVPIIEPVHDRVIIEIARGCDRGCRFCHAGIINRPVRERSADRVLDLTRKNLESSGYEECSLLSLSAGDYTAIEPLLVSLIEEHYRDRVGVSLPSLRVQGLSEEALRAIESVRKSGFTLAPEAATDRLRRVINKDYREEDLLDTARRVFQNGWRNLKLYFMIGLPTETDEDIGAISDLAKRIGSVKTGKGRPRVSVSISGFVPKPHTPFQWEAQLGVDDYVAIQEKVRSAYRGKGRRVKWHNPEMTVLEGVLGRGDRRLAEAILKAHEAGARFDGWADKFDPEIWKGAFAKTGIDPDFYSRRERKKDEVFPWDHLDPRVGREWLRAERERALRAEITPCCGATGCAEPCGACDHNEVKPRRTKLPAPARAERGGRPERPVQPEIFFIYRVRYARRGDMRFMGQLEVTRLFNRAVRRAGLPVRYSQGFNPQPRIMFGPAPPVGVASEAEYVDFELLERLGAAEVGRRLQEAAPPGIFVLESVEIPPGSASVSAAVNGYIYAVRAPGDADFVFDPARAESFLAEEEHVLLQKREKGDREVDLRPLVKGFEVKSPRELTMEIRVVEGPGVKPLELVREVFGPPDYILLRLEVTRLETLIKKPKPLRYSGKPERGRAARGTRRARR